MQTTDKLGLIIWDANSDKFSHTDLENNWAKLEERVKWIQAGTGTITANGYTDQGAIQGADATDHIYTKDLAVTFADPFPTPPYVWAITNLYGVSVHVPSAPTETGVTLRVAQERNNTSGPAVTLYWFAILP